MPKRGWVKVIGELALFNLAVAVALTLLVIWLNERLPWSNIKWIFIYGFIHSNAIGTVCSLVMPWSVPRIWDRHPVPRWALIVALMMACTFVGCLVSVGLIHALEIHRGMSFWVHFFQVFRGASVITLIIGISVTVYEVHRHEIEEANLEIKNRQIEQERALKLASEAQLASIESRIQPHFLFNTLNSISSLIREDPARAEQLIGRLSTLLRTSLDTQAAGLVPLELELKLVSDYLEIQSARFGDRLRHAVEVPDSLRHLLVPPFAIQTLVENSVKYAIAPRREGGFIRVTARSSGSRLSLEVADDGPGFEASSLQPAHGLDSLNARLIALFGDEAALDITRIQPGAAVTISIPQRTTEHVLPA